jgi:hypothetical protein
MVAKVAAMINIIIAFNLKAFGKIILSAIGN